MRQPRSAAVIRSGAAQRSRHSHSLSAENSRPLRKLQAAGVDVTVEIWPDMIHVWHFFAPMLDEGQAAIERIGAFVRQHLG